MSLIARPSKRAISAWRTFLSSPHGQEGLAWWKDQRPRVSSDPIQHLFAKSAGASDGYDQAIDKLEEMIVDDPDKRVTDVEQERLNMEHMQPKP